MPQNYTDAQGRVYDWRTGRPISGIGGVGAIPPSRVPPTRPSPGRRLLDTWASDRFRIEGTDGGQSIGLGHRTGGVDRAGLRGRPAYTVDGITYDAASGRPVYARGDRIPAPARGASSSRRPAPGARASQGWGVAPAPRAPGSGTVPVSTGGKPARLRALNAAAQQSGVPPRHAAAAALPVRAAAVAPAPAMTSDQRLAAEAAGRAASSARAAQGGRGYLSYGGSAGSPDPATSDDYILRAQAAGALDGLRPGATTDDAILAGQAAGVEAMRAVAPAGALPATSDPSQQAFWDRADIQAWAGAEANKKLVEALKRKHGFQPAAVPAAPAPDYSEAFRSRGGGWQPGQPGTDLGAAMPSVEGVLPAGSGTAASRGFEIAEPLLQRHLDAARQVASLPPMASEPVAWSPQAVPSSLSVGAVPTPSYRPEDLLRPRGMRPGSLF